MASHTDSLIRALQKLPDRQLDGMARGLDQACERITGQMRSTQAHGDDTGATRISYSARRVGRGETGAATVAALRSAANLLNPGMTADGSVTIDAPLGVIMDAQTTYQRYLETEHAGARAVLAPTLQQEARNLTQAAAEGAKRG